MGQNKDSNIKNLRSVHITLLLENGKKKRAIINQKSTHSDEWRFCLPWQVFNLKFVVVGQFVALTLKLFPQTHCCQSHFENIEKPYVCSYDTLKINNLSEEEAYEIAASLAWNRRLNSSIKIISSKSISNEKRLESIFDIRFTKLQSDPHWARFQTSIIDSWKNENPTLNYDFTISVKRMRYLDQLYRCCAEDALELHGQNSVEWQKIANEADSVDSKNLFTVDSLFAIYGWPTSLISEDNLTGLALIIIHSNLEVRQKYLTHFRKSVESNKLSKVYLAILIDKIELEIRGCQVYGTQLFRNLHTGELFLHPVFDELGLDKRRISMGLDSLNLYMERLEKSY